MPEETLLEWTNGQPDWARDALRRHATSDALSLSESDKAEILARVRHHSGFTADPAPTYEPLSVGHLANAAGGPSRKTILCSLGPVENLNRLAPNQQLRFATHGLTLVYGENGSGKSGYARIAKKLCRSLSSADLLGNVFEAGARPPASVKVRYLLAGEQQVTEATWTDGAPTPTYISNISVFDSHNARLYVDQENRISYLPKDIALLQRHSEYCAEMGEAFQREIATIEKRIKVPLPAGYGEGGAIAKLLASLDSKSNPTILGLTLPSAAEIQEAAAWTDTDVAELQQLEKLLSYDPAEQAARCRRAKAIIETFAQAIIAVEATLSAETSSRLEALRTQEKVRLEAALLAASDRFSGEPFAGVGLSAWRQMYDYAKAYAVSIHVGSAGRLPDREGDRCVLCQEPLSKEGEVRVRAFNDFVASEAAKAADAARLSREAATNTVRALSLLTRAQAVQALAEYADMDETRKVWSQNIVDYYSAAGTRRGALLNAVAPEEFAAVPDLVTNPLTNITADIVALDVKAKNYDLDATEDTSRAAQRAQLAALRDRNNLSNNLPTVLARRDDLERIVELKTCCVTVERGHISRQITTLRRSLVMQDLEQRILNEIEAFDLTHIPFQVRNRSIDGQSYFGVALEATAVANNKVLSEGEQRALALACFLGEIASDTERHGLIIDDPVSSLDHVRLRRVAFRLVEEAKAGRQVIIFTHNILFFNDVWDAACRATPPVPVHKNFIRSSKAEGFGVISESDPWVMLSVTHRIDRLRYRLNGFATVADFNTEEWRARTKDFYSDLRETWERLVEEVLLGKVVERFNTDVRTLSLKGVVVDDSDYKTVFWAMKKASERSGHDMAMGKAAPAPTPADMKADLDEIDAFQRATAKRKRDTEKLRKLLEQPPSAEVA